VSLSPSPQSVLSAGFWNVMLRHKIRRWKRPPKRRPCKVTLVVPCSVFWSSRSLKRGLIGCAQMSVWNYHSTLQSTSQKCRSHMMVWQCRPWFGPAWSSWEQSRCRSPVQYFICGFKMTSHSLEPNLRGGGNLSCIGVNTVISSTDTVTIIVIKSVLLEHRFCLH
jgi:hypothetical protein